jgi:flagellar hook-associated protein 1 FlgK
VQGLSANTDYKVKALVGTSGISLQTTAGADFSYLGSDGNANDIFVKANGRIVIKTDPYSDKEYKFNQDTNAEALGIKVSDYRVNVDNDKLIVKSTEGKVVSADTSGTNTSVKSLIGSNINIKNIGNEDLIMIINGGGARSIATRSDPPAPDYEAKASNIDIKVANAEGSVIEFLDATTGHSIATRTLDSVGRAEAAGYKVVVKGKGQLDDTFKISDNAGGTGDARNLDMMIKLQTEDANGPNSGGFREVFDNIVTGVGASVLSGDLSLEAAEATKEAAMASELEFSGVSLDTEAAQLLEQQQAFQASARILATARQLFQTLLDVV